MLWVINSEMSVMLTSIQHISRQELLLIVDVFFYWRKHIFGFHHLTHIWSLAQTIIFVYYRDSLPMVIRNGLTAMKV
jgi:hypothetical protein